MATVPSQMAEPDFQPETQVSCLLWSDSEEIKMICEYIKYRITDVLL
jgi:hypothetical protein